MMEGLKNLEYLSLVSKVCTELEAHIGCSDKTLAEFIIDLAQKCETQEQFGKSLKSNGVEMPEYFVKTLLTNIHAILPPLSRAERERLSKGLGGDKDLKRTAFPGLAVPDSMQRVRELEDELLADGIEVRVSEDKKEENRKGRGGDDDVRDREHRRDRDRGDSGILQIFRRGKRKRRRRAAVVVLGDLGRSPRMQYHSLSLARQAGLDVDVVAFAGTEPHAGLLQHPHIHLHLMRSPLPQGLSRILYLVLLPLKLMLQFLILLWVLCFQIPAPDFYLVQNPPSIPTMTVVRIACWLRDAAFVIDWHNFGYTLLALTLGSRHPLVTIHSWYERKFGKTADGFLCVTKAMQHELEQNWGIRATVVYDRSPEFFRSINLREKHELFCRLHAGLTQPPDVRDCCGDGLLEVSTKASSIGGANSGAGPSIRKMLKEQRGQPGLLPSWSSVNEAEDQVDFHNGLDYTVPQVQRSLFTVRTVAGDTDGEIQGGDHYSYEEGRPALIVSSTSWTADEDFEMLLEAAVMYDRRVAALLGESDSSCSDTTLGTYSPSWTASPFPRLLIVVTGKGPMRAMYEERIRKLRLRRVAFRTMWLSAEEYPLLLGAADLGVCLHTSSSGLDLPMKVVDMFGCGLPVCAVSYSCIEELVKDRQNGLLFSSSSELADQLLDLFKGFPNACDLLDTLRRGATASGASSRWDDEWSEHVLPLLTKVASLD